MTLNEAMEMVSKMTPAELLLRLRIGKEYNECQIQKGEEAIAITKKAKKEIKIFVSDVRKDGILGWYEGKWGMGTNPNNKTRIKLFSYSEYDFIKIVR